MNFSMLRLFLDADLDPTVSTNQFLETHLIEIHL